MEERYGVSNAASPPEDQLPPTLRASPSPLNSAAFRRAWRCSRPSPVEPGESCSRSHSKRKKGGFHPAQPTPNTNAINFFTFHCEREDHGHFTLSPPSSWRGRVRVRGQRAPQVKSCDHRKNRYGPLNIGVTANFRKNSLQLLSY